ncbi:G-PROTEIN-RECEP-F1-2 domain-containing protein [Aphelenchoides besseyi]|nr:G-PROTEIN-RECEP-F1-2 domain-containing protein [Aphelenchoides besseyi]
MSDETFYSVYLNRPEVFAPAKPVSVLLLCITLIGIVGNLLIPILTWRSPKLRNSCNYLLSFYCITNLMFQVGNFTFAFIVLSGINFIPLSTCFKLQFIPSIGLTSSSLLPMLIGIDRLISIYFPMRHSRLNLKLIMSICGFVWLLNSSFGARIGYENVQEYTEGMVCCLVPSVLLIDNTNATYFLTNNAIMNSISVLCYLIMWIRISYSGNVSETTKKSFTSFAAIMSTLLVGQGFVSAAKLLLISFNAGPVGLFQLTLFNNTCVNIVAASNAYVIIMFSRDYRMALKSTIPIRSSRSFPSLNSLT